MTLPSPERSIYIKANPVTPAVPVGTRDSTIRSDSAIEGHRIKWYLPAMEKIDFLSCSGEMSALTRAFDWSTTSAGAIGSWPQSLRTTLGILLRSRFPMFLWWGPDLICFYNDAYRPSLGRDGKHPHILGMPAKEAWPEIWHIISPLIYQVLETGEATWREDQLVPIFRNGAIEDVYWTYSYSPVLDEHNQVAGVLVTCMETTGKVNLQAMLEEKAGQLEVVIDSADLGFWDTNYATGKFTCNLRLKSLFGFRADEDPAPSEFLRYIAPRDQQKVSDAIAGLRLSPSNGEYELEYKIADKATGRERDVRAKGKMLFNERGLPARFTGTLQDITVNNRTLGALEASRREMRALFEEAPVAIATIDDHEDLHFLTANRFYGELIGRDPESIIGLPLLDALPELRGQGFDELLKKVLNTGVPYTANEIPVRLVRDNTLQTIFVNFSYIPRWNNDRRVNGILVTATDVTFQVLSRRQIEEKEALFRMLIEAAPFPIGVYIGKEMRILHANPAIIAIYGKGPDVIGKNYLELLPELKEQGIGEQLHEVYTTGQPFHSDTRRVDIEVKEDIVSYYFKYSFIPLLDPAGKVYGILNTGVDVTELELSRQRALEAEATLRSAAELAELANWNIDIPNRMLQLSLRLEEWTGIEDNTVHVSKFYELIPEDYRAGIIQAYEDALNGDQGAVFDIEHPLLHLANRHARFVHVRGHIVSGSKGHGRLTGTMQDITQQRAARWALQRQVEERTKELADLNTALQKANLELEKKNDQLISSNDELTEYAYVTSHDLQEPIRKIRLFSSKLREKFHLGPEGDDLLQKINKSSARMTQLIQDLLAYSRLLDTGEIMQPVDLGAVIGAVVEDYELSIEEKRATVQVGAMPVVMGVSLHLNQVFHNLIGNALKFSAPDQSPVIRIFSRRLAASQVTPYIPEPRDTPYFEMVVEDNGIGFEPKFAAYIFEVFKKLHSRDAFPGSGIGLALCRRIVNNHGGHIFATSRPGKGSRFHVILPAPQHDDSQRT